MDSRRCWIRLTTVVVSVGSFLSGCADRPTHFSSGTAIEHVAVVDVVEGRVTSGRTIVIEGTRIAALLPDAAVSLGRVRMPRRRRR